MIKQKSQRPLDAKDQYFRVSSDIYPRRTWSVLMSLPKMIEKNPPSTIKLKILMTLRIFFNVLDNLFSVFAFGGITSCRVKGSEVLRRFADVADFADF